MLLIETVKSHPAVFILYLRPLSPQCMQISGGRHPSLRRHGHNSLNKYAITVVNTVIYVLAAHILFIGVLDIRLHLVAFGTLQGPVSI